jgi:capsular exopolysaccharide synthesis family protein
MVGEGKSTLAAFLANTIAFFRETRTLLVDCDFRRPRVHEFFGCDRGEGLAEVLDGTASLELCFRTTHISTLKVLTSGNLSKSPVELLNSDRLREVFSEIKFYFDSIIIDSPPVIPVSDTLILSTEADGVLLVVKAGTTSRYVAGRALANLKDAGVNVLGIVLNNMEKVLPYYYDYSYYGYEYYRTTDRKKSVNDPHEDSYAKSSRQ